jgi:hypothetical protein
MVIAYRDKEVVGVFVRFVPFPVDEGERESTSQ